LFHFHQTVQCSWYSQSDIYMKKYFLLCKKTKMGVNRLNPIMLQKEEIVERKAHQDKIIKIFLSPENHHFSV
jgi:hypothetical protein